jgi:hypothetical protein
MQDPLHPGSLARLRITAVVDAGAGPDHTRGHASGRFEATITGAAIVGPEFIAKDATGVVAAATTPDGRHRRLTRPMAGRASTDAKSAQAGATASLRES